MNGQTVADPNAIIPLEAIVGPPFYILVETWESVPPATNVEPDLLARAPAIIEAVGWLTGHPVLDQLLDAIAARNGHALGTLLQLSNTLRETCGAMIERCVRWRSEKDWVALRREAELAARLSIAGGQVGQSASALFLLANAHRALGDTTATIFTYEAAIAAAQTAGDDRFLSAAYDNLGNTLKDVGRLDDALDRFDDALRHARTHEERRQVLHNRAVALMELGELRSAAQTFGQTVEELERVGVANRELAVAIDNAAMLSEPAKALAMLEHARILFSDANDLEGRTKNALNRSKVFLALGDQHAAAQSFIEAHDYAFEHARQLIDPEHYRRGFHAARAARLPFDDEAYRLCSEGIHAKDADRWGPALHLFQQASQRARDADDHAFALRMDANAAAVLGDAGQAEQAFDIANDVAHEAAERGLALPQMMATSIIESCIANGIELDMTLSPLERLAISTTLQEIHRCVADEAGLDAEEMRHERYDTGTIANELAKQAQDYLADDLAIRYFRQAIERAREGSSWFQLANRLAGLRSVLARSGNDQEANDIADELVALLDKGVLPDRGQLVAHRALGFHFAERDRTVAIEHLKNACAIVEALRHRVEPGPGRADVARQLQGLYRGLAHLLREAGDDTAAFDALQGEKGRRLIAGRSALIGTNEQSADEPLKAKAVMAQLKRLGGRHPTMLVDLALEDNGLTAYLVGNDAVRAIHIGGDPAGLAAPEWGDIGEREASLVTVCLHERLLSDLAEAVTAALPAKCSVFLVPDEFLNNLPLHVVPVRGRPWCEHVPICYLQAASLLGFAPRRRQPVGRSLVAGDSRGDLPYAASESLEVATALHTTPLIGSACTRVAIEKELRAGEIDVVHLALHGRGDGRRGGRASVLLADNVGGTEWVDFDELTALPWRAELVVFSGCSTGVAGPQHGHELASVARAVLERGAGAVIACLWPVGDEVAKVFMMAFYKELVSRRTAGPVDLREVLDTARAELRAWLPAAPPASERRRDGRSLRPKPIGKAPGSQIDPKVTNTLAWAPFVLLGDPILGG